MDLYILLMTVFLIVLGLIIEEVPLYEYFRNWFFIFYAISKHNIKVDLNVASKHSKLKKAGLIIFTTVVYIIIFSVLMPFIIFHVCLDGLLQHAYGKFYGGLLNGYDILCEVGHTKSVVTIVMILSYDNEPTLLIQKLKHSASKLHQSSFKFSSTIQNLFGYSYFLKNQVNFNDVVNIVKYDNSEYMTTDNLMCYLESNCLNIENNHLWKALIFSQPIIWDKPVGNRQLAVVLTFRHSIGDIPSLISFVKKCFELSDIVKCESMERNIQEVAVNLDNICLLRHPLSSLRIDIPFKIPTNSNTHIAVFIDNLLFKIKKIKKKYNVNFTEVLVAAIAMSIYDYALQRNICIKKISVGNVIRQIKKDRSKIMNRSYDYKSLSNKQGARYCVIPFDGKESNVKKVLLFLQNYHRNLAFSIDDYITSIASAGSITYLPLIIVNHLRHMYRMQPSLGLSNVVGLQKSTCCGHIMDDMFFFAVNFMEIDFSFFVNSYAERMQIVLVPNKGFVHTSVETEKILNSVRKYIDELEDDKT